MPSTVLLLLHLLLSTGIPVEVTGAVVNVREGAGVGHAVVAKVHRGDRILALGQEKSWVMVRLPGGEEGWIYEPLLKMPEKPLHPPPRPEPRHPTLPLPPGARDNLLRTSRGEITIPEYAPGAAYVAVFETSIGTFVAELWPEVAPNHVKNFRYLASSGFYEGLTFHRVVRGFIVQGGDPRGNGTGGPGYSIALEASDRPHNRGVLGMSRRGNDLDSAGSQFFILLGNAHHLDGNHTAFGRIVKGMEVVDAIGQLPVDSWNRPREAVRILGMEVLERRIWEGRGR
jgi:peptidyl-prolyl cis-trans isomerase B (cyclophilin B)